MLRSVGQEVGRIVDKLLLDEVHDSVGNPARKEKDSANNDLKNGIRRFKQDAYGENSTDVFFLDDHHEQYTLESVMFALLKKRNEMDNASLPHIVKYRTIEGTEDLTNRLMLRRLAVGVRSGTEKQAFPYLRSLDRWDRAFGVRCSAVW